MVTIREAFPADFDGIWRIFREIAAQGDTYAYPRDISRAEAQRAWVEVPRKTYVAVDDDDDILGTYYIKTNYFGPGAHVCNCGYMVSPQARGKGIATRMSEHSQDVAKTLGYKAMQFNFVAASNEGAIRLWTKLGFDTVGRLPRAFAHPHQGLIDALVMYKWLAS